MLSVNETSHLNKHLILRSFAYAQDDASEMCGTGNAERAGGFVFRRSLFVFRTTINEQRTTILSNDKEIA